jgi:hypothetical protein
MKRLPSLVPRVLCGRLDEWLIKGLADYFKPHADEFIKAVENTADGVTMIFTFRNPPGFPRLRDALRGKSLAIGDLRIEGSPDISIRCIPGHGER